MGFPEHRLAGKDLETTLEKPKNCMVGNSRGVDKEDGQEGLEVSSEVISQIRKPCLQRQDKKSQNHSNVTSCLIPQS